MFRSALDALDVLAQLQKAGIALHMIDLGGAVTSNGISKLVFTILSAVAEAQRDPIRERIRYVKTDQRNRSRYLGGKVPFGWSVDPAGALVEHKGQQKAIGRMKELRNGGHSLGSIAAALTADSFYLSHAGVKKILAATGSEEKSATKVA